MVFPSHESGQTTGPLVGIHLPAVLPDLAPRPSERRDVPHLHHRPGELLEEEGAVLSVLLDQLHGVLVLGHQDLVRAQKALVGHEVLEVAVVEPDRADKVEEEEVLVSA